MAETITPNLGLTKPEIGASNNVWGARLNDDLDILDQRTVRQTTQWTITMGDDTPGSLAGPWILTRYGNDGISIDNPITVNRQSGLTTLKKLTVVGATTITGGITGDVAITGTLSATGAVTFSAALGVAGVLTANSLVVTNAATIGTSLTVTNAVNAASLNISGNAFVEGNFYAAGKVTKPLNVSHITAPPNPPAGSSAIYFDENANPVIKRPDGTIAHLGVPPGTIAYTGGTTADIGWALCDGQAIVRDANPACFARLGVRFGGGNGTTTFNLPDLRGRVVAHVDGGVGRLTSPGLGANPVLSNSGGDDMHTITVAQMPAHNHSVNETAHSHATGGVFMEVNDGSGAQVPRVTTHPGNANGTTNAVKTNITLDPVGGGDPFSLVQPTIVLNAQIKLG